MTYTSKTGTSQVGAIFKAQKARSFKNCKRGTLFLKVQFFREISRKLKGGGPFGDYKKIRKKSEKENFEKVS